MTDLISALEVTQADRDAATRWGTGPVYNMQHLAEAFARHRIASTGQLTHADEARAAALNTASGQPVLDAIAAAEARGRDAGLREAAENLEALVEKRKKSRLPASATEVVRQCAAIIRLLISKEPSDG